MSDFDFDELDKAVNSLNKTDANQVQNNESGSNQATVNNNRPIPSLAAKRTPGPFMDVMHPSSNMMKNVSQPAPKDITTSDTNPINQNNPTIGSEPAKESSTPITSEAKPESLVVNDEDDDINKISEDINKTLGLTGESPFIADAQVEKRPLGAFSSEPNGDNLEADTKKPDATPPIMDNSPLPAELDSDLLSIEANSVAKSTIPEEIEKPAPAEMDQVKVPNNEQKSQDSTDSNVTPVVSMPQQYVEKTNPKSENNSIYNNDTYKQTLMPAKKKAGWLWVVWILLLILIGAGVGAAVYFFVLEP